MGRSPAAQRRAAGSTIALRSRRLAIMSKLALRHGLAVVLAAAGAASLSAQSAGTGRYQPAPQVIVDILDAAPTPTVIVSPGRQTVALLERRSMPTIADL